MRRKLLVEHNLDAFAAKLEYTSPLKTSTRVVSGVDHRRQVIRYTSWLYKCMIDTKRQTYQREAELQVYQEAARTRVTVGNKTVQTFAPFRSVYSALHTLSRGQLGVLFFLLFLLIGGMVVSYKVTLVVVMAIVTTLYLGDLLLQVVMSSRTLVADYEEHIDEAVIRDITNVEWPSYTILCPLYEEAAIMPQFIHALLKLDYPVDKLEILLLLEEHDRETYDAIKKMDLPSHFVTVLVPAGRPQTKPRACNYGLLQATGDYIVIYDAEDIMDPLQLKRAVLTFANHDAEMVCVQAKLNFYNVNQNLLTRWFTAEYSSWFDLLLPGLQYLQFPLPLGGTSNHFRAEVLRALGGWDAFNVTEDCELGIRLGQFRLKVVIVNSTTFEEATSQLKNWMRQRSRWIKGYMQTYFVHMRHPLQMIRQGNFREFIALQFLVGGRTLAFFVNLMLWIVLGSYILFRSKVEGFYQEIFPPPVLYMGTVCLILGNFFYIYINMCGCVRRHNYHLVKWALFIPVYWVIMSVAAGFALFQLIVKPHYWEKTVHGLHLKQELRSLVEEPVVDDTHTQPGISSAQPEMTESVGHSISNALPPLADVLQAVPSPPARAFSDSDHRALRRPAIFIRDIGLLIVIIVSSITSITASLFFFLNHETLIYDDAYSHIRVARSVVDSLTPGFAQLGGVWLPLHHMLMLPFIWNDTLWQTGFAGSIPSMIAYVIACTCLFLLIRRFTFSTRASFLGTLVFLLNPDVLYLQSTALSEVVCVGMVLMVTYFFLCWVQHEHIKYLVFAACGTFLASLIRYDGWALFLVLLVTITLTSIWKRHRLQHIEGNLLLFGTMGGLGIELWLLWCYIIFGDALYFQRGPYSAQAQQKKFLDAHTLYTYHNAWQAIRYYSLDSLETIGVALFVLACVAIIFFYIRYRFTPATLAVATLLTPFVFYASSLYFGQAILYLPQALPATASAQWFNVRYGVEMVAPLAFFLGVGLANLTRRRFLGIGRLLIYGTFIGILLAQVLFISNGNNLALNDGLYNRSCASTSRPIHVYLAQHYNGQKILTDEYTTQINGQVFGAPLHSIVYEGSGFIWKQALAHPERTVDWVIMRPKDDTDLVAQHLTAQDSPFATNFTLVQQEKDGLSLYLRTNIHALPNRPVPENIQANQRLCSQYSKYTY